MCVFFVVVFLLLLKQKTLEGIKSVRRLPSLCLFHEKMLGLASETERLRL